MKHNKLKTPQHETLIVAKCSNRACPFPCEPGSPECHYHSVMKREPQIFLSQSTTALAMDMWFGVEHAKE